MPPPGAPPETIALPFPGITLRRARVEFAESVAQAVADNLEHLSPWMPWANEQSTDTGFQRERLARVEIDWDEGTEYQFVLLHDDNVIGSPGLMSRQGPGTLELGYWVAADWAGRGIATAAAAALTDYALGVVPLAIIRCDAANVRSNAVAMRLGYELDRVEARDPVAPAETGVDHVWHRSAKGATSG